VIVRILAGLCTALFLSSLGLGVGWQRADVALHASEATRESLRQDLLSNIQARQSERDQCAADFAGEVERNKVAIADATRAATARASLTTACAYDKGPQAVTRALRDVLGEPKQ
jgi:hypothetical protein